MLSGPGPLTPVAGRPGRLPPGMVCIGLLLTLQLTACEDRPGGRVEATNARIRAVVPGQDKTAGYFVLHNASGRTVTLVGVHSDAVRTIEMHETVHENGMAGMRRLPSVALAPGSTVPFAPGGRHLMLFGVTTLDGPLPVTLELDDGTSIPVKFDIVPLGEDIR